MKNIEWFYPTGASEASELIIRDGFLPHAGSTGLLMRKNIDAAAIIDLSRAGFDEFKQNDDEIEIGAMMTYAELCEIMRKLDSDSILYKAINGCVPHGLLNRITIGGSVAMFPIWSDIMGPLIALNARVKLIGKNEGEFAITEYISKTELHKGNIITKVIIPAKRFMSDYFRQRRTEFDYNAFSITILTNREEGKFTDTRIAVVGCKGKYKRLEKLENYIDGKCCTHDEVLEMVNDVEFSKKSHGSSDFMTHLFKTALLRKLNGMMPCKGGCK